MMMVRWWSWSPTLIHAFNKTFEEAGVGWQDDVPWAATIENTISPTQLHIPSANQSEWALVRVLDQEVYGRRCSQIRRSIWEARWIRFIHNPEFIHNLGYKASVEGTLERY